MTRQAVRAALVLAAATSLAAACGATGSDGGADASVEPGCTMVISVTPASPEAPETIYLEGSIVREGFLSGTEAYQFGVTFDSAAVTLADLDPYDGSRVSFEAPDPGPYRTTLSGAVGSTDCVGALETVNVTDPGANVETYRFRFVPAQGQPAPVQDRLLSIPGGAAYSLGTIGLDSGVAASGHVRDSDASPLAAYLRVAVSGGDARPLETFADASGAFGARLAAGTYSVLVVPVTSAVAPNVFTGVTAASLGLLTVTEGDTVTGVVLDTTGAPVEGARVSLRVEGVPSTIATSDASGAFSVLARAGGATAVSVSPPQGSGLPRLELAADAGLVASSSVPLTIRYAPELSQHVVTLDVLRSDGITPAPGARVTFVARAMASAGTVTPEEGAPLVAEGALRLTADAAAGGALPSLSLPEAVYDVIAEPDPAMSGEGVRLTDMDLSIGAPASLSLAQPALLSGQVVDSAEAALSGVTVTAVPCALLANLAGASARASTSVEGAYELPVVGGGEYDLLFASADSSLARTRLSGVVAPAAGESSALGATGLPRAIAVTGRVEIPGVAGGAAGVHVMALCHDCTGVAARAPVAEAVTEVSGSFVLAIPDPGVEE